MHCGHINTPHARIDVSNVHGKFAVHTEGPAPRGTVAKVYINAFDTRDSAFECASQIAALMGYPNQTPCQSPVHCLEYQEAAE